MTYDPFAIVDDTLDAYAEWLNREDEYPWDFTPFDIHLNRWNHLYHQQEIGASMISLVERRVWGMAQNIGHWQMTGLGLWFKRRLVADYDEVMAMTDQDLWNTVRRSELSERIEAL